MTLEHTARSPQLLIAFGLLAAAQLPGCYVAERDQALSERDKALADVSRLEREKADLSERVNKSEDENRQLKLTPRYFFDQASEAERSAQAGDSDDSDRAAIAAFREMSRRFPEDPLAEVASRRVAILEKRIVSRAAALKKAQADIVRLIQVCHREATTAENISSGSLHFVGWNQQIDMNSAMDGDREAEPHRKAASAAQERATALLGGVRDPGGQLKEQVNACDNTN